MPQSLRSREEAVREARRLGPFRAARHEAASLVTSFNYAFEGIIYVLRTQRNMRVHFAVALGILPVSVALGVTRFELLAVMLAVSFVLIAEMINTALEKAIDVATNSFDPLARVAKDVAAGAVLVAAVNAVFVGYLVFADRLRDPSRHAIDTVRDSPVHLTVIAVAVVTMLVISLKAATNRGTPLRGGLPSGHAAVAYGGWVAVTFAAADYAPWPADLRHLLPDGDAGGPDAGRGRRAHHRRGRARRPAGRVRDRAGVPAAHLSDRRRRVCVVRSLRSPGPTWTRLAALLRSDTRRGGQPWRSTWSRRPTRRRARAAFSAPAE